MDTGYNDHIPGLPVGPGLQPSEITWHRDKLEKFAGSTILLSHHQLFSANSEINKGARPYVNESLLATFSPYFDKVAAWFWGHEHNFVLFEDGQHGLKRGRLIGCSSMNNPWTKILTGSNTMRCRIFKICRSSNCRHIAVVCKNIIIMPVRCSSCQEVRLR